MCCCLSSQPDLPENDMPLLQWWSFPNGTRCLSTEYDRLHSLMTTSMYLDKYRVVHKGHDMWDIYFPGDVVVTVCARGSFEAAIYAQTALLRDRDLLLSTAFK